MPDFGFSGGRCYGIHQRRGLKKQEPLAPAFRLSKNLYNEKGRPPYPYQSAKSRDLCVAFCTSQGRGAPLANILCPGVYNLPEPRKTGSGGSPPAPCKNSKKWPKPLFRNAQAGAFGSCFFVILLLRWVQTGCYTGLHRSRLFPAALRGCPAPQCPLPAAPECGRHPGWWTGGGQ